VAVTAEVAIGLDFGTSSLKLVAHDSSGRILARIRRDYPTARPTHGAAEQHPAHWLAACDEAMLELATRVPQEQWGVIGLSAMLPTLVSLDSDLRSQWPAITWEDSRADDDGAALSMRFGGDDLYRLTGQRLDGRYLLPMHIRRSRSADGIRWAVGAKDYLFLHLTGELLTDPSTASGYGAWALSGEWRDDVLALADQPRVPAVVSSTSSRGLNDELATRWGCARGLPVLLGAADSVLGAYGLGLDSHGAIAYIAGTSSVILGWSTSPTTDPYGRYIVTPMAAGGFGLELDLLATGSAFAWLAALFGLAEGAAGLTELASDTELADAPMVLPYFAPGEQGALWDASLTGAVEGLTLRTTREQLARGLVAGVVCESKRCIDALDDAFGETGLPILLTGSGGRPAIFRQDLADATGREIWFDADESDHSALGAALLAGRTVLGWSASSPPSRSSYEVSTPRAELLVLWQLRFEEHERMRAEQSERRRERQ
jgi:xylulokinase